MSTPEHEKALTDLLRELNIDAAPGGFTDSVMERVQENPASKPIVYKAPIGRLGWIAIAAVFIGLCVAGLNSNYNLPAKLPQFQLPELLPTLPFGDVSPAIPMAFLALTALLFVERLLSKRRQAR